MVILLVIFVVGLFIYSNYRRIEPFQTQEGLFTILGFRSLEADATLKKGVSGPYADLSQSKILDAKTQKVIFDETTNTLTDSTDPIPRDTYFKGAFQTKVGWDKPKSLDEIRKILPVGKQIISLILKNASTGAVVFDPPESTAPSPPAAPLPASLTPLPALPATAPTAQSAADSLTPEEVDSLRGLIKRFPPPKPAAKPSATTAIRPTQTLPGR